MQNLILFTDNSLSLSATGGRSAASLLTIMLNCPEKNYRGIEELYDMSNDDLSTIGKAVHELLKNKYLICVGDRYAVNKIRIPEMKVINSAPKAVRISVKVNEYKNSGL